MAITEESRQDLFQLFESTYGREGALLIMEYLPPVGWADVATKRDLDAQTELLSRDIAAVRQDLSQDIAAVRQDLSQDIAAVRQDLSQDIAAVRQDMVAMGERLRTSRERSRAAGGDRGLEVRMFTAWLRDEVHAERRASRAVILAVVVALISSWLTHGRLG